MEQNDTKLAELNNEQLATPTAQGPLSTNSESSNITSPELEQPNSKKPNTPVIISVVTSILALVGIAAGIYFFMDSNNKSSEISNLKAEIANLKAKIDLETGIENGSTSPEESPNGSIGSDESTISEEEVFIMVNKYIGGKSFDTVGHFSIIESGLDDLTAKVYITLRNVPKSQIETTDEKFTTYISYDTLNQVYKTLFGQELEDLPKQNYFSYGSKGDKLIYDNEGFLYEEAQIGSGQGYRDYKITSFNKDGEQLVVNLIYLKSEFNKDDKTCSVELADGESIPFPCFDYSNSEEVQAASEDILNQYSSRLASYQMVFSKNNTNNYSLKNIIKQ